MERFRAVRQGACIARVFLDDDEPGFVISAGVLLRYHGHNVRTADTLASARRMLDDEASEAVLLDLMLPDGNGLELLEEIAAGRPDVSRVVIMTGHPGIKSQISYLSGPGISYLTKPIDSQELMEVLRELDGTKIAAPDEEAGARLHFGRLVGESPPMLEVYRQIERISRMDSPVLIQGETGTGKELVTEAIHRQSARSGAYSPINCGSLSRELAGSELFGHERGSFTGTTRRHTGFFEQATGGSLLLDELTEMPFDLQPHFLRVLESYAWPGNVRELRHVIHRAYILADSDEGELELPARFESPFPIENRGQGGLEIGRSIRDMERELILRTLEHFEGDKHAAAEVLGVSLNTLYNRLHQYKREKASQAPPGGRQRPLRRIHGPIASPSRATVPACPAFVRVAWHGRCMKGSNLGFEACSEVRMSRKNKRSARSCRGER